MTDITIFRAQKIVTMNPSNPTATHVAVRGGKILGAGTLDEVKGWGEYTLDDTFADKVLVPGLIEAHSHAAEGMTATFPQVGYFDRPLPDGSVAPAIKSYDALIAKLKALDAAMPDPQQVLITQGFDPIYFPGERLSAKQLDQVSTTRPILVFHASGHLATVNTAMLKKHNITRDTKVDGVARDANGDPNGELQEMPAISLAESALVPLLAANDSDNTIWNFGSAARNVGCTTIADLSSMVLLEPAKLQAWSRIVNDARFPARLAAGVFPAMPGSTGNWSAVAAALKKMQAEATTDKFRPASVKFVLDGSIQGWTAVLNEPGYYTGKDQGQLLAVPEQFADWLLPFHQAGINIFVHCNGNKTADLFIDAVEQLIIKYPWLDHRHTVHHAQLLTSAQFRRMAKLGMCANLFTNHIWYWGDQHYALTVGPERANSMEACATAKREGVHFSMHSDASVTPLGQLHTMWCAVNRVTPSGRVLGEHEKISAYDALYAVTVDAAYQLHLDHEIGSIEAGKFADFTVLDASPLDVDPMAIKDINVWGTVLGGVKYPKPHAA